MIAAQSLICGIRKGPASWFGHKPAEWRYVNRNGIRSTVIGFGSTWTAVDAFKTNSKRVPKDQEDADDCEFAAADHMFEQLDAAVKRPSAIQYSGPNIRITIICSLYASASRGQIQKILRDDGAAVAYHAQTNGKRVYCMLLLLPWP